MANRIRACYTCFHTASAVLSGNLEDCQRSQQESANRRFETIYPWRLGVIRFDFMLDAGNEQSNEREGLGMYGRQGRADWEIDG
jgi:hypothetical protein